MSIQDYRAAMAGAVPGAERLVMQCEDGGRIQAFCIDETIVRVGPTATPAEVKQAFLEALKE